MTPMERGFYDQPPRPRSGIAEAIVTWALGIAGFTCQRVGGWLHNRRRSRGA
jgi:hypothetical protein